MKTPTSQSEEYDLLVLGSGQPANSSPGPWPKKGMKTAVIERKYVGGSCPNIACLPSKNVIHSAKVASYFRRSEEFGISKDNWKINMAAVRERKRKMVAGLVDMHLRSIQEERGGTDHGSGRFVGPKTIEVTSPMAPSAFFAGSMSSSTPEPARPLNRTPGLAEAKPLTHIEALELDHIPEHLLSWAAAMSASSCRRPCAASAAG